MNMLSGSGTATWEQMDVSVEGLWVWGSVSE